VFVFLLGVSVGAAVAVVCQWATLLVPESKAPKLDHLRGGIVVSVHRVGRLFVLTVRGEGPHNGESLSVCVEDERRDTGEGVEIRPGDVVWWQDRVALWTPAAVVGKEVSSERNRTWSIKLVRPRL
jgi:hypothetical protein